MQSALSADDTERLLDEVLAGYLKAAQLGLAPPRQQLLDSYPELAAPLAEFFADQDHLERLAAPLRALAPPRSPLQAGLVLDDYELLEEIAHGGMGVVFRARQKSLPRVVALKILRVDPLSSNGELQRFRTEVEAVAHLEHPHIVPIYDVGTHAGRPWFSMKLIEGGTLAGRMPSYQADLRAAARLLATVAHTVHFAHERGILHRDLKPANILLDSDGTPYVSDFGLAKRLLPARSSSADSTLPETVSLHTVTGAILGTPSYMAPEQAAGLRGPVTTAADVYSLGVILYELLTGKPPFRGGDLLETLRRLQEQEPAAPRSLNPAVPRDLETICLKCLRKEPGQRYPSARALALDLERYLQGEPIEARPATWPERLSRLCRRNPWIVALSASLLGVILTTLVLVTWLWRQAEASSAAMLLEAARAESALAESQKHLATADSERKRAEDNLATANRERKRAQENLTTADSERQRAQKNLERAEEILTEFCIRLSEHTLNDVPGLQPVRRDLLQSGRRYYEALLQQDPGNDRIREHLAKTYHLIADVTNAIGSRKESFDAYSQALVLYEQLRKAHPSSEEYAYRVAMQHQRLAILHAHMDHPQEAADSYEEARKLLEPLHRRQPKKPTVQMELANLHNNLAVLCSSRGQNDEALAHYEKNIALLEDLSRRTQDRSARLGLGITLTNMGMVHLRAGRGKEGRSYLERARDQLEELHATHPRDLEATLHLALAHFRLGTAQCGSGETEEGLKALETSQKLLEPLVEGSPRVRLFRDTLADVCRQRGLFLRDNKHLQEALACFDKGLAALEPLASGDPTGTGQRQAAFHFDKGTVLSALRRLPEAEVEFTQARNLYRPLAAAEPGRSDLQTSLGMTLNNLTLTLQQQRRPGEALQCAVEARDHNRTALKRYPQHVQLRELLSTSTKLLAALQVRNGQPAEAIRTCAAWRDLYPHDGGHLYAVARMMARCIAAPSARATQREEWARQTVETLAEACRRGFKDGKKLADDPVFKELRQREDFQKLLREIKAAD